MRLILTGKEIGRMAKDEEDFLLQNDSDETMGEVFPSSQNVKTSERRSESQTGKEEKTVTSCQGMGRIQSTENEETETRVQHVRGLLKLAKVREMKSLELMLMSNLLI